MKRNILVGAMVSFFVGLSAPCMVHSQETREQPEIDPAGNQQSAPGYLTQYPDQQQQQPVYQQQDSNQGQQGYPQQQFVTPEPQYPYGAQQITPQEPQYGQPSQGGQQYGSPYYSQPPAYNYNFGGGQGGYTGYSQAPSYQYPQFGPQGAMLHPRVATAPAGLTIPVTLQTAISTQVAKEGDFVQASIGTNVQLQGLSYIPSGSVITGQVTEATSGRMMNRSGSLGIEFTKLQLPSGQSVSIQAHVLGDIGKYQDKDGTYHGEGWGAKLGNFALRSGIGAGAGAALGMAMGGITHGSVGTGAWSGAAIGGGIGALDDVFLRRGKNVLIQSGTPMQIQLDAAVQVPVDMQPSYGAS